METLIAQERSTQRAMVSPAGVPDRSLNLLCHTRWLCPWDLGSPKRTQSRCSEKGGPADVRGPSGCAPTPCLNLFVQNAGNGSVQKLRAGVATDIYQEAPWGGRGKRGEKEEREKRMERETVGEKGKDSEREGRSGRKEMKKEKRKSLSHHTPTSLHPEERLGTSLKCVCW